MKRVVLALAFLVPALLRAPNPIAAQSMAVTGPPPLPCDLVSCSGAWDVNRAATKNYTGPLFEIDAAGKESRIRQTATHAVDLGQVRSLCGATLTVCRVSEIFDEIGANHLLAPNHDQEAYLAWTASGHLQVITGESQRGAAPYLWAQNVTGLPIGNASRSVVLIGSNAAANTNGFGAFGYIGTTATAGLMYSIAYALPWSAWSFGGQNWALVDEEGFNFTGASLGSSFRGIQDIYAIAAYDHASNKDFLYANGALIAGPHTPNTTINTSPFVALGRDGDGTDNGAAFYEGFILSDVVSDDEAQLITSSARRFYDPDPARNVANATCPTTPEYPNAIFATSPRRLYAAWQGPARTYRRSDGMEFNVAFNGCDLDVAALNRLAGGLSLTVVTAWSQTPTSPGSGSNSNFMTQAIPANQPAYVATGINRKPSDKGIGANGTYLETPHNNYIPAAYSPFAIISVFQLAAPSGRPAVLIDGNDSDGSGNRDRWLWGQGSVTNGIGLARADTGSIVTGPAASANTPHFAALTVDNALPQNLAVYFDGTNSPTRARFSDGFAKGTGTFRLYGNAQSGFYNGLSGDEVIMNAVPNNTELTTLCRNVAAYWETPAARC